MDIQLPIISITARDVMAYFKRSLQIPAAVRHIAQQRLIEITALELGVNISMEELQAAADQLRQEHHLLSQQATLSWLKRHVLDVEDLEVIAREKLLAEKLALRLFENHVEPYFLAHIKDFLQLELYEIVVNNVDLAWEIHFSLLEHELSFADAAIQYSQDAELARLGGYRGHMYGTDIPDAIATAAYTTAAPKLLKPILVGHQYHLIYLADKVSPSLTPELKQRILDTLFLDWLEKQLKHVPTDLSLLD